MIKWCLFLKSLKQLFITLLISCFILLVNSSVSAYRCNPDNTYCWDIQYWEVVDSDWYRWTAVIDNNLNFYWLTFDFYNWEDRLVSIWWQDNWLYQTARNSNLNITAFNGKWSLGGYFVCSNKPLEWKDLLDSWCTFYNGFNWISLLLKNNNSYLFNCRNFWSNYVGCSVCSYNVDGWDYVCIDNYTNTFINDNSFWSRDQILSYATKNPYSSNVYRWTSFTPSTWSRLDWRLVTNSWYTNSQMVEAYQCVWLIPELCYWGFPITDIFEPSETFEDFTWYIAGQGATIFDLYNRYSSNFSNINQFLSTVLNRYQNWQINSFKTEPKALLMLWAQMNTAWLKTSYISTYCDLLLNKNNSSLYTWTSIDDLRAQSCYRSQNINDSLKTSDWLDIILQGSQVWIFGSWDDIDFDPETFFSNLIEKISSWLDRVSVWTAVWVIPWYIVLFTLALILIRLISH